MEYRTHRTVDTGGPFRSDRLSGSSGLSKAFPSLDDPVYVPVSEATDVRPDDEIVGLVHEGRARAYPTWASNNFHIVNDRTGSQPLLVDT